MGIQVKLSPPIIETKIAAQASNPGFQSIAIPFLMNKAVGWSQFYGIKVIIKTIQSSTQINLQSDECIKDMLVFKDGKYWATFQTGDRFTIGQTYKVQIAYIGANEDGTPSGQIGHYSSVGTFKFTTRPSLIIEGLGSAPNVHIYNYTGVFSNADQSERAYSYRFDLYDESGKLVTSSGEQLHDSSKDTSLTASSDTWSTRYVLNDETNYSIVYYVTTVNGLQCESQAYRIYNGLTFDSNVINYCNFIAEVNQDDGYVDLSIQPKPSNKQEKYISGQFNLLRASSEDNFSTWNTVTTFLLSSHNVFTPLYICKDYCVSQGVAYKYVLQAFNSKGVYSNAWPAIPSEIFVDFEDMFLTDGDRQLKIQFNPKVTSFKNTLFEAKIDTIGGKYPFFFRNGNTSYKEFPISGLISMLMDPNETFMKGIQFKSEFRDSTPSTSKTITDTKTSDLTGDNIRREREFKIEVLKWLTNGKPKLFRSPSEGSYIVRLMNVSLVPNDTLGRMLHTFSCTAYEIDDYNFENLRKYGMMVEDYVETRALESKTIHLGTNMNYNGVATNLNACVATIHSQPYTTFRYLLKNSGNTDGWETVTIGSTGIYTFDTRVLNQNELMTIAPPDYGPQSCSYWDQNTVLNYFTHKETGLMNFSHIDSVNVRDAIKTYIGDNSSVVEKIIDPEGILTNIGTIYHLKVRARPIIPISRAVRVDGEYKFYIDTGEYSPTPEQLLRCEEGDQVIYYDADTKLKLGTRKQVDFTFELNKGEGKVDMSGIETLRADELNEALGLTNEKDKLRNVDGRLILTDLSGVNYLYLGNGVYADIVYQEVTRVYTVEITPGTEIFKLKEKWKLTGSQAAYEQYYRELLNWCQTVGGDKIVDAV